MNPRITPKDRNAIKGALRRAFSRSELHRRVLDAAEIQHSDPKRPKVKRWCRCNICGEPEAISYCVVDHIDPMVPIGTTFAEMTLDTAADRLWCEENNLQCVDEKCHDKKSAVEREQRKLSKKQRNANNGKSKRS